MVCAPRYDCAAQMYYCHGKTKPLRHHFLRTHEKEFADFPQLFSYWFSLHGLASVVEQYGQDDVLEQRVLELAQVIADGQTYQQGLIAR